MPLSRSLQSFAAEYVHDNGKWSDSCAHARSEPGFRPAEWLRVGVAGQRTGVYGGDRAYQRGLFALVTWERVATGGCWFNPWSSEPVFAQMIGMTL